MLSDARRICLQAIESCIPDRSVKDALKKLDLKDPVYLVAVGKAAYAMAKAASETVNVRRGIIISKYNHIPGNIKNIEAYEAGHPVLDENGIRASERVLSFCRNLKENDQVVFLLSGGASALFEKPLIPLDELQDLNGQMLKKGLNIEEINTIRKKLSLIKGGGFARACAPAKVYGIILSDVLEDRLDVIGSGPTVPDESSSEEALRIIEKYDLKLSEEALELIRNYRQQPVTNACNIIIGSVSILCKEALKEAEKLGYKAILLDDKVNGEAREAAAFLYDKILEHLDDPKTALIMGGETTVTVKGKGEGGRNTELVFSQIRKLRGMNNVLIMSLGSDGTDGPTDAAGGYIDGSSYDKLVAAGGDYEAIMDDNDTYNGLKLIDGLIMTGATGTNVNDITIALIDNMQEENDEKLCDQ